MEGIDARAETTRYDTVAEEREPAWVMIHLERLHSEIDEFARAIDRLDQRLGPVLAPESPHAMLEGRGDETAPQSHVANALESHWARLAALTSQLNRLTDRVEV